MEFETYSMRIVMSAAVLACAIGISIAPVRADEVRMSFSIALPPYTLPEAASGIEVDILREALAHKGHMLVPLFIPQKRAVYMFKKGDTDGAHRDWGQHLVKAGAYLGKDLVAYQDVMVSLKSRHFSLKSPASLKGLSLVAFNGARKHYPEWTTPRTRFSYYQEINSKMYQLKMLFRNKIDVILLDVNIFRYLQHELKREGKTRIEETTVHQFTPPYAYRPAFKTVRIRDDYNAGIEHLRRTGRYQEIYSAYID